MILIGENISTKELLVKSSWKDVANKIILGSDGLKVFIKQLRTIKTFDKAKYQSVKKDLPYFTTSIFHPAYRLKDNFAAAYGLIIDLDHLPLNDINLSDLRERIRNEKEVLMEFVSPSGEGLKIAFQFAQPIYDASLYKAFYKRFVWHWTKRMGIGEYCDFSTNDVTRATFLSHDPSAYFNHDSIPLEIDDYISVQIDEDDFSETQKKNEQKIEQGKVQDEPIHATNKVDDIINDIRIRLDLKEKKKASDDHIYVPQEVDSSLPLIKERLYAAEIELLETKSISYGRAIKVGIPNAWSTINIFYGRKGFSVVISPQRGSNLELGKLVKDILLEIL
jgi:hypothetical protein